MGLGGGRTEGRCRGRVPDDAGGGRRRQVIVCLPGRVRQAAPADDAGAVSDGVVPWQNVAAGTWRRDRGRDPVEMPCSE